VIYIYSPIKSARLIYVLDFFFTSKGMNYHIIDSKNNFLKNDGLKINYSKDRLDNVFQINPEGLLFENHIKSLSDLKFTQGKWTINTSKDIFSIVFYMLTSYEEYLIKDKDQHQRFSSKHSFLFKNKRLCKPNADIIIQQLWQDLGLDYSKIKSNFNTHITFDIDSAWAIKNKGFFRSIASDLKDLLNLKCINNKFKVRLGSKKDPFDTYDTIKKIAKTNSVTCFFLLGDWAKYDKNINWKHPKLKRLIIDLNKICSIGIHPSYSSFLIKNKVTKELNRLNKNSQEINTKSRQHFLRLNVPNSYELLESIGITDDYSMGFSDNYGFRSGTSFSYPFFNLKTNSVTKVIIHPITYMDGTLNQYLNLSIKESIIVIEKLKEEVRNVGGTFCPLWHNETIGEIGIWKGWTKVFESNF